MMTDRNDNHNDQNGRDSDNGKSKGRGPRKFGNLEDRKLPNFGNLEDRK